MNLFWGYQSVCSYSSSVVMYSCRYTMLYRYVVLIRLYPINIIMHSRKLPYRCYARHTLPSFTIIRPQDVVHCVHFSTPKRLLSSPFWLLSDMCSTSGHLYWHYGHAGTGTCKGNISYNYKVEWKMKSSIALHTSRIVGDSRQLGCNGWQKVVYGGCKK